MFSFQALVFTGVSWDVDQPRTQWWVLCVTLRFEIPSTGANAFLFQCNVLENHLPCAKTEKTLIFLVHTQVRVVTSTSRAPKKSTATSHGEPSVNHTIITQFWTKSGEKQLNIYFPHIF